MITLDEVKKHIRVDLDDDDDLIQELIEGAIAYLKNATEKEYPATNEQGEEQEYPLEKIYLKRLIAYWYENRSAAAEGKVSDEFTFSTRSLLLQLQL